MSINTNTSQICSKSISSPYRSNGCKVSEVMYLTSMIIFLFSSIVTVAYNIPNLVISVPGVRVFRKSTMVAFFLFIATNKIPLKALILPVCVIANYDIGSHDIWKSP